jgi:hypothetical protein
MPDPCRCGFAGEGEHPCHGQIYSCRKPAKHRFYNPALAALAGFQMKVVATETWACDECWEKFSKQLAPQG